MSTTQSMSDAQASKKNAEEFRTQLTVLHNAAVGVLLTRTREPYRAIDSIKAVAFTKRLPLFMWTVVSGWTKFKPDGTTDSPDGVKDPNAAIQKVGGLNGDTPMEEGYYVMMYPHFYLKPGQSVVPIVQAIKEYTRQFSHTETRRLVLVAPLGFTLPPELEEDVVILDFEVPSYAELGTILDNSIGDYPPNKRPKLSAADRDRILAAGSGMSAQEFETAFARAMVTHRAKLPDVTVEDLAEEVMKVKIEVVRRSEVLEVMDAANMADVGGLETLKDWIRKRARCFGQEARDAGVEPPKGIALIGPPGTGKSLLAKASAWLLGLPLIRFDVSRVFQGLVGASEERVRAALKMLDAMAPCVAMLDEVDKAFQTGSGGDSGVSQRVLGLILTHMQESKAPIFWIASANRTQNLPAEFLRKGRLDEVFSVSVPDADERLEIIQIHLRKRGKDPDQIPNLAAAVAGSDGYVPAEIEAAVKEALVEMYAGGRQLDGNLIAEQLRNMVPLSIAFSEQFTAMRQWAEQNARPASGSKTAQNVVARSRSRPQLGAVTRSVQLDDEPTPA